MKRIGKIKNKVSIVNFALALILLGILLGNSLYLLSVVKQNNHTFTQKKAEVLAGTFEEEYFRLNRLMTLCSNDPDFILGLAASEKDAGYLENMLSVQEKLGLIKASMPYADDVYAFKQNSSEIITVKKGIMDAKEYWQSYGPAGYGLDWLRQADGLISAGQKLYYICHINNYGRIVIDINTVMLIATMSVSPITTDMDFLIFAPDDTVVLQSDPGISLPAGERYQPGQQITIGGNPYYVFTNDISSIGYRCAVLNPVTIIERNLKSVNSFCIAAIVLSALFSGGLILFNRKIYQPVERLMRSLGPQGGSEIDYLAKKLEELSKREKLGLDTAAGKWLNMDVSLYYLFYNDIESRELSAKINQYYQGSVLGLLACQNRDGEPDKTLADALCRRLDGEITVTCDKYMTAFILPEATSREEFLVCLRGLMAEKGAVKVFVSFSDPLSGEYSIKEAFLSALTKLESASIESAQPLTIADGNSIRTQIRYLKLEIQQQIVNCVMNGSEETIEGILAAIVKGSSSLSEFRTICKTISSLLDYMVNTLTITLKTVPVIQPDYGKMYHPEYMSDTLMAYFRAVSQGYQKGIRGNLQYQIADYLNRNYSQPLSLESIAEHFHITPVYLSTFFKKETGENLSVYLANLRMNEARRLLTETGLKISEISEKVGIPSQTTFIRQFKKHSGLPPNEYRRLHGKTEQ